MWYEALIAVEALDSLQHALQHAENEVIVRICLNSQTYLEKPREGTVEEMWEELLTHPIFERENTEVIHKTDENLFYNIADWRRDEYYSSAAYTIWGESDAIMPRDAFYILENLQEEMFFKKQPPHLIAFASRPMWDNSWDEVTHQKLQGYSKPCKCVGEHIETCIELLEEPLKYKDYITQEQLDAFNGESPINLKINRNLKIDGALLCLSGGLPVPFIPSDMHFVREDTCAEIFFDMKKISQYTFISRLKGHNYKAPHKRVNTDATRDDEVFKMYAEQSKNAMYRFLSKQTYIHK